MTAYHFIDSTLVGPFASFCQQVEVVLQQHAREPSTEAVAASSAGESVAVRLRQLVEDKLAELHSTTRLQSLSTALANFKYLLAAWADERMLTYGFEPRVETLSYGTSQAGEQVFAEMEQAVLRNRPSDVALGAAYLVALQAGFAGRYFGEEQSGELARLRQALVELCCRQRPIEAPPRPAATASAIPAAPTAAGWIGTLLIVVVVAIALVSAAWILITSPARSSIEQLDSAISVLAGAGGCR